TRPPPRRTTGLAPARTTGDVLARNARDDSGVVTRNATRDGSVGRRKRLLPGRCNLVSLLWVSRLCRPLRVRPLRASPLRHPLRVRRFLTGELAQQRIIPAICGIERRMPPASAYVGTTQRRRRRLS